MSKQDVYLLTNFSVYLRSFSPIIVVGEQLKMMKRAGYNPVLIVSEGWEPPKDSIFAEVDTKEMYPAALHGPEDRAENVAGVVDLVYQQLTGILPDNATVITHDLIFLPDYTIYNLASRKLAVDRPSISWLHWIHSATNPVTVGQERNMYGEDYAKTLSAPFPNSIICYPNAYDIPRVARNFSFEEDYIIEVPHSTDPTEGMHPIVQRLYDAKKLGDVDVLMVLPVRLDRGKYVEANVRFIAACKQIGVSAHLVVCDFQSTAGDKTVYREELKKLALEQGAGECVTFLSEFDDLAQMEVSHDIILDLFTLSNVFCLASKSETYSLIAQEALLRGNLALLNHDFAPFRQIYGKNVLYKQFDGANIAFDGYNGEISTQYDEIDHHYQDMARAVKYYLENDRVLRAKTWVRTKRNPDYVFREYIEPLIKAGRNDQV